MFDYLTEKMLKEFFTVNAIIGGYAEDKKAIFDCLGRVFLVPEDDCKALFPLVMHSDVLSVETESDYHQYRRARQYFALRGYEKGQNSTVSALIELKGAAIKEVKGYCLHYDSAASKAVACGLWTNAAESGNVLALHTLGILLSEGVEFAKDEAKGWEYVKRAANWNSEEGLMAALCYGKSSRGKNLVRLREKLSLLSRNNCFEMVERAYGKSRERLPKEFMLLEKAFNQGTLKRDVYEKGYARILYSKIIGMKDKESILFTPNKELFSYAADLPLKLGTDKPGDCCAQAIESLWPARKNETGRVLYSLNNLDLRNVTGFRPLCLVSDSNYLLERYARAITEYLGNVHTERIEVADLTDYELEPAKSNIFVRGCYEDEFNAYFMFFRGDIHERVFEIAASFLQSAKRSNFRLYHPFLILNLGAVLPVCFCSKKHENDLSQYCDIVKIAPTSAEEKAAIVNSILSEKCNMYCVEAVTMQDGVRKKMITYSEDEIESIIETVIREHRYNSLHITEEIMRPYFNARDVKKGAYGFNVGGIHE